jgi:RND superfamily putative drug exporter
MLTRLADLGIRAPKRVLAVAGLLLVLAALYGASAANHLSPGGFRAPNAGSTKADNILTKTFDAGAANLVYQVSSANGVNDPAVRAAGVAATAKVAQNAYASQVVSYWTAPANQASALRSKDGKSGLIVAFIAGSDKLFPDRAAVISRSLVGTHDGITIAAGGQGTVFDQVNTHTKDDLKTAEMIAIPLTVLALMWVFGSVIASLLPLAIGLTSIIGTMAILRGLSTFTDVSIYALNMTTAMGLALAIDYSLFIVSRYREELRGGASSEQAVRTTMQTAGRTVLFSALTVGLSLSAMLVFPVYFLTSFAYAGLAVVSLATVAALVILPAALTLLQHRTEMWDIRVYVRRLFKLPPPVVKPVEEGFWYNFAHAVMKRALPVGLTVTAILMALGLPFLHARFAYPDDRVLPTTASAHQVGNDLRANYAANAASTIDAVVPNVSGNPAAVGQYASQVSQLTGVTSVSSAAGVYVHGERVAPATGPAMTKDNATYLAVHTDVDPVSGAGKSLLAAVKQVHAPWTVLFSGYTAVNHDSLQALGDALPYALGLIALATFVVLFLFTGSVVLPIKALVLNMLSLSATFGAMVWIFQQGHFGSLYPQLTTTGYLVPTMPPLMFCLAFGLSMDYEVFLLSRIREAWLDSDQTSADNTQAVALGLGRTGRIVTAAALLMAIVFAPMATSSVSFMMLFGTGLTLAVLMDATIVRGVLVPSFMRLAGRWNWWAPKPLAKLHERFGLAEGPSHGPAAQAPELVGAGA